VANQEIHTQYGGVVPELASRAHQQNIVPVIDAALHKANIDKEQLSAIAFTQGPGLMGSLLVGSSFKIDGFGLIHTSCQYMQAHILAHFIDEEGFENLVFHFSSDYKRWTYSDCSSKLLQHDYYRRNY
jgi:N6-L-threonylcarbamoyladenine synthase